MANKALVTGGTGFLGSAIVRDLLNDGHAVKVFTRKTSPMTNLDGLDVETVDGDLLAPESLAEAMKGVDRVYHCAALYKLSGGYEKYLTTNVEGTRNVMRAAHDAGIERVVHTSSIAAVGGPRGRANINEDQVWNFGPLNNPYMSSKFISEHEALSWGARGLQVVVVNPGAPIGPRDLKPTPTGGMVLNLLRGWYPMWASFPIGCVDVDDCARQHRLAMEKGRAGERYLSVGDTLSLADMGRVLREVAGAPWRPTLPRFALTLSAYSTYLLPQFLNPLAAIARFALHGQSFDTTKAERDLGMTFRPLRESLKTAADWYTDHAYTRKRK